MERVVAVRIGGEAAAYPFSRLRGVRVVNDVLGGSPIAVFWTPGTASALDDRRIAHGRDIGATGVFDRRVGGRTLTFEPASDTSFRDRDTGTTWDLLGSALDGPLLGARLSAIPAADYFWFAWSVFRPETRVWD